jgi:integrase
MAVIDRWHDKDGQPTARYGKGLQWQTVWYAHGRQRAKSFRTKGEATRWDAKIKSGGLADRAESDITVDELAAKLLATKAGLSPKTREMYANGARHVLAEFSGLRAAALQPSEIRAWIGGLQAEKGPHGAKQLVPASGSLRQQVLHSLSSMLDLAVEDGLLDENPVRVRKITADRGGRREARFLTMDELIGLAAGCGPYELMVLFMGLTGVRIGEACALRVGMVDLSRGKARIYRSLGASGEGKTKTRKGRDVPLPPELELDILAAVAGRASDEFLFTSPTGQPVNSGNWRRRVFYPAVEEAGLGEMHVHDLRHTAASLAISSGATIKDVQEMMGHATATMTLDLYGHRWAGHMSDVGVRMGELLIVARARLRGQHSGQQSAAD